MGQRPDETIAAFTIRRMRADWLEEAAKIVLAEAVEVADDSDIAYNTALEHAAEAIREAARR